MHGDSRAAAANSERRHGWNVPKLTWRWCEIEGRQTQRGLCRYHATAANKITKHNQQSMRRFEQKTWAALLQYCNTSSQQEFTRQLVLPVRTQRRRLLSRCLVLRGAPRRNGSNTVVEGTSPARALACLSQQSSIYLASVIASVAVGSVEKAQLHDFMILNFFELSRGLRLRLCCHIHSLGCTPHTPAQPAARAARSLPHNWRWTEHQGRRHPHRRHLPTSAGGSFCKHGRFFGMATAPTAAVAAVAAAAAVAGTSLRTSRSTTSSALRRCNFCTRATTWVSCTRTR